MPLSQKSTRIELYPPEIKGRDVVFRWDVSPSSDLYHQQTFTLSFPEPVDPTRVPERLWWTVFLLCMHSHWTVLRPCTIHLPIRLPPGEVEGWHRLLDSYIATIEAQRGGTDFERNIEILEHGKALDPIVPLEERNICAAAFSGGKDSLVQSAMLCELRRRPILVTTTSPMPDREDHGTQHRRKVLKEICERRDLTLLEVHSDYRSAWDNSASGRLGYPFAINEISDTFLYTATLLAAGYALGATHLFLASENEVSQNEVQAGRFLQHKHFMYSALTQAAIGAMLAPVGLYYGSLTTPLHSCQVQELLNTRYRDLKDLQFSCWRPTDDRRACSECLECYRLAWVVMSLRESPSDLGIDLVHLLTHRKPPSRKTNKPYPPNDVVAQRLTAQVTRALLSTSFLRVLKHIATDQPRTLFKAQGWQALRKFRAIQKTERQEVPTLGPPLGYRAGFLTTVDPPLREGVRAIFEQHFHREDERDYADQVEQLTAAIDWVTAPLGERGI